MGGQGLPTSQGGEGDPDTTLDMGTVEQLRQGALNIEERVVRLGLLLGGGAPQTFWDPPTAH